MQHSRRRFLKTGLGVVMLGSSFSKAGASTVTKNDVKAATITASRYDTFDVIVVGGGMAGISAAMGAARNGADVLLLERDHVPGGAPVSMYVTYLCGGPVVGFYKELITELNEVHTIGGTPSPTYNASTGKDLYARFWHPTAFVEVILKAIRTQNEKNSGKISLVCNALVSDITKSGQKITGVRYFSEGEVIEATAKVTIDATGLGELSEKAGCQVMFGLEAKSDYNESIGADVANPDKIMPCTWMIITHRIKEGAVLPFYENNNPDGKQLLYGSAVEDLKGWITDAGYINRDAGTYLHWGVGLNGVNTRQETEVAKAQEELFNKLNDRGDVRLIQEAGFAVEFAPRIGIRECRRVKGEFVMTTNELGIKDSPYYERGFVPHDMIAEGNYFIDAWGMDPPVPEEYKRTTPYGVPLRSCIPLGVEGFMTAGRIISGTHLAMSSYRVQPITSSIGFGVGTAAAIAALNHDGVVRAVDGAALRSKLSGEGYFSYKTINENK